MHHKIWNVLLKMKDHVFIGLIKNKIFVWYKSAVKGYLIEKKGIIKLSYLANIYNPILR